MITETEKLLYKSLCSVFGAFLEFTQGAGGNISVKTDTQIILKSSGTFLSETSITNGYVVCDRRALEKCLEQGNEHTSECVVFGEGRPSMEAFFHLLPSKLIVHVHPTSLLPFFRQYSDLEKTLFVPYVKPGIELARRINSLRSDETLILLENHGVIIMGDTEADIFEQFYKVYKHIQSPFMNNLDNDFFKALSSIFHKYPKMFLSEIKVTTTFYDPIFLPYTPDIFLFLKAYPLHIEKNDNILKKLIDYNELHSVQPSIITIKGHVFAFGETWKKCIGIGQIFQEYLCLARSVHANTLAILSNKECSELLNNTQEKFRLAI